MVRLSVTDNGVGFDNSVRVIATEGADVIAISGATVSIVGRLPVNLTDIQQVNVEGRAGNEGDALLSC